MVNNPIEKFIRAYNLTINCKYWEYLRCTSLLFVNATEGIALREVILSFLFVLVILFLFFYVLIEKFIRAYIKYNVVIMVLVYDYAFLKHFLFFICVLILFYCFLLLS